MTTNTVRLHRILRTTPDRVYAAFVTPAAMAKWLPPNGFTCTVHAMDAKVGGSYKMSFADVGSGQGHSFGGEYLELVPGERIRYTAVFDDPAMSGQMQTTVTLTPVACGTEINVVQEGIPAMIPTEMCYLGWQQSLVLLGLLVERQ
ncbi:MAG: SRPBCC family protein [Massilia sp.]